MIISVKSLDSIFCKNNVVTNFNYNSECYICGSSVNIGITKTSGGYGLKGGVMYEQYPNSVSVLCDDCFNRSQQGL